MPGFALSGADRQKLQQLVRRSSEYGERRGPQIRPSQSVLVKLSSTTATGGLYPGNWYKPTPPSTLTSQTPAIWVWLANSGWTPNTSDYCHAYYAGSYNNGGDRRGLYIVTKVDAAVQIPSVMEGRLYLVTGDSRQDGIIDSILYYGPHAGNLITLYDGTQWVTHTLTEIQLDMGTKTASTAYEIFVYDDSGTLKLEEAAMGSTALQDGVYVRSGATNKRFVGTVYVNSANFIEDANANRYLRNWYNQIPRSWWKVSPNAHAYNTGTWRSWNNDTTIRLQAVFHLLGEDDGDFAFITIHGDVTDGEIGVGINSTTTPGVRLSAKNRNSSVCTIGTAQSLNSISGGHNYFQALEYGYTNGDFDSVWLESWLWC